MRDEKNRIDERHRKELLGFLLVKTAAVRQGVKPAELLRVRHCYEGVNSEGLHICLYRSDIYGILGLDYMELKVERQSSLVLFYNPAVLGATLAESRNRRWPPLGGGDDAARGRGVHWLSAQGRGGVHAVPSVHADPPWRMARIWGNAGVA